MEILKFLENIRTPFFNTINMLFSYLASEVILIMVLCFLYWCFNKKLAYRLGFVYFISGIAVQVLKVIFKIPRPWLRDTELTPVQSAVGSATGYSFPSGHTQSATSLYGTFAYIIKKTWVQIVMILLILCVAFSRMYLGVHTPLDVSVAFIVTIIITLAVNYAADKKFIYRFKQRTVFIAFMIIPILMVIYGVYLIYTDSIDIDNAADYFKAAGAALGFIVGWYMETSALGFDEREGSIFTHIIKYVFGLAVVLVIKSGLKIILGTSLAADFVRYGIITFWIIFIYPFIFSNILKHNKNIR